MFTRTAARLILVCFFGLTSLALSSQARYRVNNNPSISADFVDLASALAGVTNGDILIIEHSDTPYNVGEVVIDKSITIYGTGYFLEDNPGKQADVRTSQLGPINVTVPGVFLSGLTISQVRINSNSVKMERCYVFETMRIGDLNTTSAVTVQQCYFRSEVNLLIDVDQSSNFSFINNLVWNESILINDASALNLQMSSISNGLMVNNIFYGECPIIIHNVQFDNNVFEDSVIDGSSSNVTASNNYAENPFLGLYQGGDDAIMESDSTLSVNQINSRDRRFELRTDIPNILINGGSDGSDAGMYGGGLPYIPSGIPPIPSTYYYNQATSSESTIDVQINTRTNK